MSCAVTSKVASRTKAIFFGVRTESGQQLGRDGSENALLTGLRP